MVVSEKTDFSTQLPQVLTFPQFHHEIAEGSQFVKADPTQD